MAKVFELKWPDFTVEGLESIVRAGSAELLKRYDERKGKDVDERWCIGCGVARVSGDDPERPGLKLASCVDCKEAYDRGERNADQLRKVK